MARYSETFTDTITGAPIAGALITVTDYTGGPATIYTDGGALIPQGTFLTGVDGGVVFNAADGRYGITYSYGGRILREDRSVVVGSLIVAVDPSPANAGKFVALDASGVPVYSVGTGADAGLRTDIAASTGAALVGASDGAGGTLWTSVSGFIARLISSAGSSAIGFLQTGTGAVTRTMQSKGRDWLDARDFGVVGDNSTDDQAKLQIAITAALALGRRLELPEGTIRIGSRITVTMPNPAVGPQATNFFAQLVIRGKGFGRTIINCPSSGWLRIVGSSQQHAVDIQDLTIATGGTGTSTAIEMDCGAYPWFAEHTARSTIKCEFRGNDGLSLSKYWGWCVDAIDWSHIDFSGSSFNGSSTPAGGGVRTRCNVGQFVCKFWFIGCDFRFLATGYEYGDGTQSTFFDSTFFGLNQVDILVPAGTDDHQGLSIVNCECYELGTGPFLKVLANAPNITFVGNRIAVSAGQVAVQLDVTNQTTITDNQFFPDTSPNTAVAAISIDGTVAGSHCVIDDNNFAGTTIGAQLKSGSSNVHFGAGNVWTGGMLGVSNAATGNLIGTLLATPLGRVGYRAGAGGNYTQSTSKTTAVPVTTPTGRITTNDSAVAAGAEVAFTVNYPGFNGSDIVLPQVSNGNYAARVTDFSANSFVIRLRNLTGGSLADAVVINYAILGTANA